MPEDVKVIKRYQNRKLYDTRSSRYVTLEDIAQMIRAGEDIKVIDNSSKQDLTTLTLTQIIFDQEKKTQNFLPQGLLTRFIQSGGESMQDFFDKRIAPGLSSLSTARAEFEKYIEKLVAKGHVSRDDGLRIVKDFVNSGQKGIDEVQHRIEQRSKAALKRLNALVSLQQEVEDLESKVDQLETQLTGGVKSAAKSARKVVKKVSAKKRSVKAKPAAKKQTVAKKKPAAVKKKVVAKKKPVAAKAKPKAAAKAAKPKATKKVVAKKPAKKTPRARKR
ncbi:MAG: polyhydroxyalkanoate synthesis regulator DNA-binding domain-containing protein [Candidatus Alcyoniella australis]|nr:polyhydroxyalkanoate synthesis regulator DNA-binding domain-containing protein [Candidatus Alcyoniella australis]